MFGSGINPAFIFSFFRIQPVFSLFYSLFLCLYKIFVYNIHISTSKFTAAAKAAAVSIIGIRLKRGAQASFTRLRVLFE